MLLYEQRIELIRLLEKRFEQNMSRHENLLWNDIQTRLEKLSLEEKFWSLNTYKPTVLNY